MKPFAESCEENKLPILAVLKPLLAQAGRVLEIGSGTGQHAVFFAGHMPHLSWQTSELACHHAGIRAWLAEGPENVLPPLELDVRTLPWGLGPVDAVFSANTAHIMAWDAVEAMFAGVGETLVRDGVFALYGPFNYGGCYSSESNQRFDQWLHQRDPLSGIRDFEALDALAVHNGMELCCDHVMPVNNRTLIWRRR